ncbi:MAG TPA: class I SAM-dependent methyltransferase [Burkholderiales bacterium]|nr:class I SAM-dependent methyltransferase [Burkholderiales bacterium]
MTENHRDTSDEKHKWDAYYGSLEDEAEPAGAVATLYRELAETMGGIVPAGSRVLEAGCGSGQTSLALARLGRYEINLLDFSEEALQYARRVFERAGIPARFEAGDVLRGDGHPEHDLVFNSGVLEHYSFEDQVSFLQGMKRRSRRYVFVLVPNRACYWYWIWRLQTSGDGQWPFGYEKPASSYRAAMEAAQLNYLGRAYFGASAASHFLGSIAGLDPALRERIITVHRQEIVPLAQRSYLVGFLGSVGADDVAPAGFSSDERLDSEPEGDWADRYVTLAADALAAQIAAQQHVSRLEQETRELHDKLKAADLELQKVRATVERDDDAAGALTRLRRMLSGRP